MNRFDGIIRNHSELANWKQAYLPNLYVSSHAANFLELNYGDLLCVFFSGSEEGAPDCNIVMSRLPAGSDTWTKPMDLSKDLTRSEQNPVLFQTPSGSIWLLHTSYDPGKETEPRVIRRISDDNGYTWSEPETYFGDRSVETRHPILVLPNGDWLLPCNRLDSLVKISSDQGQTWQEFVVPNSRKRIHMNVIPLRDGSLFAMFRSSESDRIYFSRSSDYGRTWTEPVRSDLPNNHSSTQMIRLMDGRLALVYNPVSMENGDVRWYMKNGKRLQKAVRTPLALAISEDEGKTWPDKHIIQTADDEYWENEMGYSYPSIIQTRDEQLHIAYTYLRKGIKYVRLDKAFY
ncbi:exo-alpha-sialidase [Paenibacillus sp. CC-CFT747]|nr:exo-alpha-sialidase [Paenibacillus sp. CC-CFT747]